MTIQIAADRMEVFHVPDDYPEFECEDGSRIERGAYWWFVTADGVPDSYPIGPFDTVEEAAADAAMSSAAEPPGGDE